MREIQAGGRKFLAFEQLARTSGLRHAFTTRDREGGGNLSLSGGRDRDAALAERLLLSRVVAVDPHDWVVGGLVHGSTVTVVNESHRGRGATEADDVIPKSDALLTATRGLPLFTAVADCAAVLLYAPGEDAAMATVHAGWRGLQAGVLGEAVEALQRTIGRDPATYLAGISPCIGLNSFEVGEEVSDLAPDTRRVRLHGRWHVDLPGWAHDQLHDAGLPFGSIEVSGLDTADRADLFFSHRRDGADTGRMGLLAVLEDPPGPPQAPRG